jgi:peptide deformylase
MIKELMHDPIFLARKSENATADDIQIANDLLETLVSHKESCVGMAANMIGECKRIIAFLDESGKNEVYTIMLNPEIIKKEDAYNTEEGCLSLMGGPRKCKRYKSIKVKFQTLELQTRIKTYTGWTAQIIQHEIDHCDGILI